jgi:membrane protein DedA with SNARE-associated domain/rhodanese-related sulfurtransferase
LWQERINMELLLHIIATYGLLAVFVSVFLDQGGLPLPAYPILITTSAIAWKQDESVLPIVLVASFAAVAADWLWFVGGRRLGARLVQIMCRLSLSPDSCIVSTRRTYSRWGPASLIVAKFVPGLAAVATTMAGEARTRIGSFLLFDGIGAALWASVAVVLGVAFSDAVESVLDDLDRLGHFAWPILLLALIAFIGWKWLRRHYFVRQLRMTRISSGELHEMLQSDTQPLIIDVRSEQYRVQTGWIPGAIFVTLTERFELPPHDQVVVYCDCPDELSAALLSRELKRLGCRNVRPLAGGFEAWRASGHPIDGLAIH